MLKQAGTLICVALQSLPQRLGPASVLIIGIAGVVAVLVGVLAMAAGLQTAFVETGHADRAIVLREGAASEGVSTLTPQAVATITNAPGIRRLANGRAAASAELVIATNVRRRTDDTYTGVTVRGVSPEGLLIRPEIEITAGRSFEPGLRELIVGRNAQRRFRGLDVGSKIALRDGEWTIVGVFTSRGDLHESELLADASTLLSAFQRTLYSAVTVQLDSPESFPAFEAALANDPSLMVEVMRERDYYEKQSQGAATLMYRAAMLVGWLMALGALLAAANTMYSAVSARSAEIATLRAMGFNAGSASLSVLTEALLLALLGAFAGGCLAWLSFGGRTLSTVSGLYDSQIVFQVDVGLDVLLPGVLVGCLVGLLGGLPPAIRAARIPVASALRAVD